VGKTLLHGDVLMWLMKTLLTSWCINQRGAGHDDFMLRVKPQVMELLPEKVVFFRLRSFERNCSCYKIEEPNFLAFKK
ncbi:hypothetical protein, partial [Klebsiella pneumoniae]|uniref:hypothetical protein n=1 Tax=Klebsiella pneumoniae TaxID=573 RepID=UPI001C6F7042